jgi:hypothetical protein
MISVDPPSGTVIEPTKEGLQTKNFEVPYQK